MEKKMKADEFKNEGFRLPHSPSRPPPNIPKGKRSNRTKMISSVDTKLDVEEQRQNKGKNSEECIPIRTKKLENPSKSEMEAAFGLLKLSEPIVHPKRPYSAVGDEENGGLEKKMKAKKENTSVLHGSNLPPELPAKFKEGIDTKGGSKPVLVIQKKIFDSDVDRGLNRLSIPESKVKNEFLSEEERAQLLLKDEKGKNKHIEIVMIGPSSPQDEYRINLVKWEMKKGGGKKSSWTYNLVTTWNTVVKENNLRSDMIIQVWSFRVDSKLNFALVIC